MHTLEQQHGPRITTVSRFHRYGRRGFTIIEVLVALGILAVGIASVYTLLPVAAILQKQAIDATQGPEFGASVLAVVKQLSKNDPCFGDGSVTDAFIEVPAGTPPRFNLNGQPNRNYNYRLLYRRLVNNGPVEVAVMVYRKLPGEEAITSPITTQATAITTTGADAIYGVSETDATKRGFMRTSTLSSASRISGNLLLIGNNGGAYYVTSFTVVDSTGPETTHTLRVSPIPPETCENVVSLVKSPSDVNGNLLCVAIVTGVIE